MSVTTMPMDGDFNFSCKHCGEVKEHPPKNYIKKNQEMCLYSCNSCKELTLIVNGVTTVTLFKVET